jgi:hypothetical protein
VDETGLDNELVYTMATKNTLTSTRAAQKALGIVCKMTCIYYISLKSKDTKLKTLNTKLKTFDHFIHQTSTLKSCKKIIQVIKRLFVIHGDIKHDAKPFGILDTNFDHYFIEVFMLLFSH